MLYNIDSLCIKPEDWENEVVPKNIIHILTFHNLIIFISYYCQPVIM